MKLIRINNKGFSVVEVIIVAVFLLGIAGVGAYVVSENDKKSDVTQNVNTSQPGTVGDVNYLSESALNEELRLENDAASQEAAAAEAEANAISGVGDGYDTEF